MNTKMWITRTIVVAFVIVFSAVFRQMFSPPEKVASSFPPYYRGSTTGPAISTPSLPRPTPTPQNPYTLREF